MSELKIDNEAMKTVKCRICGNDFVVDKKSHRTLCDDCAKPKTKTLICQNCGKEFTVGRGTNGSFLKRKFCNECFNNIFHAKYKIKVCKVCGKEFKIYPNSDGSFNMSRVRCEECQKRLDNKETKTLICQKCGKSFTVGRGLNGNFLDHRKYCDECNKPAQQRIYFCQICGKEIVKTRENTTNIYSVVKYCDECREKAKNDKRKKTMLLKYGVENACQLPETFTTNGNTVSKLNLVFFDFLKENGIDCELEFLVGSKYRYDFHVLDTNILIELNPTYTHTVVGTYLTKYKYNEKYEMYHLDKINYANSQGYHCIHVWQWDDWNKIIDLIKPKQKLYARKLELKEIDKNVANTFLDIYHLQRSCYGNEINLGLFSNNQLVQVMTFGKPRYNKNYQYELLRLCSHSNYIVVGGAERLFKHFIKNYQPKSVISYCDISKFTGDVYKRLGFDLKEITEPAKVWSKEANQSKNFITDNLLRQQGFDRLVGSKLNPPQVYGKNTSNEELMVKHGWLPVYDCGQKVFEWHNKCY